MAFRSIARSVFIAGTAVALGSLPAAAQTVTFSTTGAFSGGGCSGASCAFDGFTLTFTPVGSNSFLSGSLVDLGSFNTQCVACTPGSLQTFPAGVTFTLTVNQTGPSAGSGAFAGTVSGSLAFNPSFSSLVWTPSPSGFTLGSAGLTGTYAIVLDNTGNFNIAPPTTDANPNPSVVKALVTTTTTPEPGAAALMATGMLGLIPVLRRRRT
jgi:MYXO-CTERM domain-containing protein